MEKSNEKKFPNTTIEVYPNVKDKIALKFVICLKLIKNVLEQFPNIKVIQSVGESLDYISNSQNVSINRIVDEKLSDVNNNGAKSLSKHYVLLRHIS
ncbi:hypothetical protein BXQ17_08155 [Polaribacter sp. BM10]|uniref:hypothetical protein n=1 Tax=Polaribacter sp. BM10 TaxID=1529069 RepID=UPI000989F151|nr:hypothetical protein [Polaribacter sp. BM10]AQS94038.1 hypothetical protein BXQ17_08155 [Polaribacter sp. BM10]